MELITLPVPWLGVGEADARHPGAPTPEPPQADSVTVLAVNLVVFSLLTYPEVPETQEIEVTQDPCKERV